MQNYNKETLSASLKDNVQKSLVSETISSDIINVLIGIDSFLHNNILQIKEIMVGLVIGTNETATKVKDKPPDEFSYKVAYIGYQELNDGDILEG